MADEKLQTIRHSCAHVMAEAVLNLFPGTKIAIGPAIMMKFVAKLTKEYNLPTTVSLNPIMIDGTGMCGCCRVLVGTETKFACVEGPEFDGHLVDFDLLMKRQAMYKREEHECNLKLS